MKKLEHKVVVLCGAKAPHSGASGCVLTGGTDERQVQADDVQRVSRKISEHLSECGGFEGVF